MRKAYAFCLAKNFNHTKSPPVKNTRSERNKKTQGEKEEVSCYCGIRERSSKITQNTVSQRSTQPTVKFQDAEQKDKKASKQFNHLLRWCLSLSKNFANFYCFFTAKYCHCLNKIGWITFVALTYDLSYRVVSLHRI